MKHYTSNIDDMKDNRFPPSLTTFLAPPAIVACLELLWNTPFSRLPIYWLPFYAPFAAIILNSLLHIAITCAPVVVLGWLLIRFRAGRRIRGVFWFLLAAFYVLYMSSVFWRLLWWIRDNPTLYSALVTLIVIWTLGLVVLGLLIVRSAFRSRSPARSIAWPATLFLSAVIGVSALAVRWPLTGLGTLAVFFALIVIAHIVIWLLTRSWRPSARLLALGFVMFTLVVTALRVFWAGLGGSQVKPNIIISLWDTARADRMSVYGYENSTTPFAEKLANQGTAWHKTYSSSNQTLLSHISIFTGLYVSEHNLWFGSAGYEDLTNLAEELARRGYRTILIAENFWPLTIKEGFSIYFAPYVRRMSIRWAQNPYRATAFPTYSTALSLSSPFLARQAIDSLRHQLEGWYKRSIDDYQLRLLGEQLVLRRSDQPLFLFFNWMNVHSRYYPGPEYRTGQIVEPYRFEEEYDESVCYTDRRMEALTRVIDRAGEADRTIYVITADHGQMHGEQNIWGHVRSLFDPVIRVPLLVSCGSWSGREDVYSPVTQITIKPMILSLAGEDYASPEARQRMKDIMADHRGVVSENRDADRREDGSFRKGFTYLDREGRKLIYDPTLSDVATPWNREIPWGAKTLLVFDLMADPTESTDISETQKEVTDRLFEAYNRWEEELASPAVDEAASKYPPGLEKQMRALGYDL